MVLFKTHIELWKQEHSSDITHCGQLLNLSTGYEDLIARVLYECMEKNSKNINYLRGVSLKSNKKKISASKYPVLSLLISKPNLDYIFTQRGHVTALFDLLMRPSLFNTLYLSFKYKKIKTYYDYKGLDLTNINELSLIKYIFKNKELYQHVATDVSTTNSLAKAMHHLNQNNVLIYLMTPTHLKFELLSNCKLITQNLDLILEDRISELMYLTGITMCLASRPDIKNLNDEDLRYSDLYPEEYKLTQTLLSLGITDFDTVFNAIINVHDVAKKSNIEMPPL